MPMPSRDYALQMSASAVADSRNELWRIRSTLRITDDIVRETRACIAASIDLRAEAERLLEKANRLFATR